MKRFIPLIIAIFAILIPLFVPSCANTTEAPSGGKKDTIPPYITDIIPLPGTTGVDTVGTKFVFTFSEYVTIKNKNNITLSPPQSKKPIAKLKGKSLVISLEEALRPNTTYTINFTDAIADNNEGNMFAGYTYVFSTGNKIDSMLITGTVQDCNTLNPVKGAVVLLHRDLTDSAIFKTLPYATAITDDWGYFTLPYIQDTFYRLYAIKDANNNFLLDPESELVGFADSIIRPVLRANDTIKEMLKYDMLDTLACQARKSEYDIRLFREKPSKQLIVNKERTSERSAYITFMAQNTIIDSIQINNYQPNQIISQFNIERDSLELWINSRRAAPDTMRITIDYRKTDSLGRLVPSKEQIRLAMPNDKRTYSKRSRRNLQTADTTCTFEVSSKSDMIEQEGIVLEFRNPLIYEKFDSIEFSSINPRQVKTELKFNVERDSTNLRRYTIRPQEKFLPGYEYFLKIPHNAFRDIHGFWSDSTKVKCNLPTDDELSIMHCSIVGVNGSKYIVELLNEKLSMQRRYVVNSDQVLDFPYLRSGKYCIRITEDSNRNSIVDSGSLIEKRQPEQVRFYLIEGEKFIMIPRSAELNQEIDLQTLFKQ